MEVYYKPSDIVWVKLGPFWWPGEVVDKSTVPELLIESLKKEPVAIVKYFDEDGLYEIVKTPDRIFPYNCDRKNDFIKKGMDAFRAKNPKMTSFPKDVSAAEIKTGGNANILSDPVFTTERKRNYAAEIFGSPNVKKPRESIKARAIKSDPIITHRRFLGYDDYEARILIQSPEEAPQEEEVPTEGPCKKFICPICQFSTERLGILTRHTSCHMKDVSFTSRQPIKKPQKRKRRKALSDDDLSDDEKKTKTKRKYTKKKSDDTLLADDEKSDNDASVSSKDKLKRKLKKKTSEQAVEEKKDICTDIIADWDDESNQEDSNGENTTLDSSLNKTHETVDTARNDSTFVDSSFALDLTDAEDLQSTKITEESDKEKQTEDLDKEKQTEESDKEKQTEESDKEKQTEESDKEKQTEESDKEKQTEDNKTLEKSPNKSCFDFDEDEEETKIPDATSGRKIPRVIPISERKKSFEFDEVVVDEEEEKKKKILEESEELAKVAETSIDEDKEVENLEKTYQSLMESTENIELPDVPNILKNEQNFHSAKTVKYPDKPDGDSSDLIEAESENDKAEKSTEESKEPEKEEIVEEVIETKIVEDATQEVEEKLPEQSETIHTLEEKKLDEEEAKQTKGKRKRSTIPAQPRRSTRSKPALTEADIDAALLKFHAESEDPEEKKGSENIQVPLSVSPTKAEEHTVEVELITETEKLEVKSKLEEVSDKETTPNNDQSQETLEKEHSSQLDTINDCEHQEVVIGEEIIIDEEVKEKHEDRIVITEEPVIEVEFVEQQVEVCAEETISTESAETAEEQSQTTTEQTETSTKVETTESNDTGEKTGDEESQPEAKRRKTSRGYSRSSKSKEPFSQGARRGRSKDAEMLKLEESSSYSSSEPKNQKELHKSLPTRKSTRWDRKLSNEEKEASQPEVTVEETSSRKEINDIIIENVETKVDVDIPDKESGSLPESKPKVENSEKLSGNKEEKIESVLVEEVPTELLSNTEAKDVIEQAEEKEDIISPVVIPEEKIEEHIADNKDVEQSSSEKSEKVNEERTSDHEKERKSSHKSIKKEKRSSRSGKDHKKDDSSKTEDISSLRESGRSLRGDRSSNMEKSSSHKEESSSHKEESSSHKEESSSHKEESSSRKERKRSLRGDNSSHREDERSLKADSTHKEEKRVLRGNNSSHKEDDRSLRGDNSSHKEDGHSLKADTSQKEEKRSLRGNTSSHRDDRSTKADNSSHIEGERSLRGDNSSHKEDRSLKAESSHKEEKRSLRGNSSHRGDRSTRGDNSAHIESERSLRSDKPSHKEDDRSLKADSSHKEEKRSLRGNTSHRDDRSTRVDNSSHIEAERSIKGDNSPLKGDNSSHKEGKRSGRGERSSRKEENSSQRDDSSSHRSSRSGRRSSRQEKEKQDSSEGGKTAGLDESALKHPKENSSPRKSSSSKDTHTRKVEIPSTNDHEEDTSRRSTRKDKKSSRSDQESQNHKPVNEQESDDRKDHNLSSRSSRRHGRSSKNYPESSKSEEKESKASSPTKKPESSSKKSEKTLRELDPIKALFSVTETVAKTKEQKREELKSIFSFDYDEEELKKRKTYGHKRKAKPVPEKPIEVVVPPEINTVEISSETKDVFSLNSTEHENEIIDCKIDQTLIESCTENIETLVDDEHKLIISEPEASKDISQEIVKESVELKEGTQDKEEVPDVPEEKNPVLPTETKKEITETKDGEETKLTVDTKIIDEIPNDKVLEDKVTEINQNEQITVDCKQECNDSKKSEISTELGDNKIVTDRSTRRKKPRKPSRWDQVETTDLTNNQEIKIAEPPQIVEVEPVKETIESQLQKLETEPAEVPVESQLQILEEEPVKETIESQLQKLETEPAEVPVESQLQILEEEPVKETIETQLQVLEAEPAKESIESQLKTLETEPVKEAIESHLQSLEPAQEIQVNSDAPESTLGIDESSQKEMNDIFSKKESSDLEDKNAAQIELIFGSSPLPGPSENNIFVEKKEKSETADDKHELSVPSEEKKKDFNDDVSQTTSFEQANDLLESVESQVARITHYEEPVPKEEKSDDKHKVSIFDTPEKLKKPEEPDSPVKKIEDSNEFSSTNSSCSNKVETSTTSVPKTKKTYLLSEQAMKETVEKSTESTEKSAIKDTLPAKSADKTNEVATKLTNPKKRFVKSFEDSELNKKKEKSLEAEKTNKTEVKTETTSLIGKSPIAFKLKKQFLSKISNIFDEADEKKETKILPKLKSTKHDSFLKKKDPVITEKSATETTSCDIKPVPQEKTDIEELVVTEVVNEIDIVSTETKVEESKPFENKCQETSKPNIVEVENFSIIEQSVLEEKVVSENSILFPIESTEEPNELQEVIPADSLEQQEDVIDISKTEIITTNFPLVEDKKEETEYVSIDGNLTVVSEKELAEGQVEITSSMPSKKPMTLLNFSMDFSDDSTDASFEAFKNEKIQGITESLDNKNVEEENKEKQQEIVDKKKEESIDDKGKEPIVCEEKEDINIKEKEEVVVNEGKSVETKLNLMNNIEIETTSSSTTTTQVVKQVEVPETKKQEIHDVSIDDILESSVSVEKDKELAAGAKDADADIFSILSEHVKITNKATSKSKAKDSEKPKRNERKAQLSAETVPVVNEPLVIYNTVKSSTVTDMCDLEDHIPSQIVCTKNALINEEVMKGAVINNELAKDTTIQKAEPQMSKLLSRLTADKKDIEAKPKEVEQKTLRADSSLSKNLLKAAIKNKTMANTSMVHPAKSVNKAIILSEKIIRPARETSVATSLSSKRTYEDVEDIEPYVITKTPKLEIKKDETPGSGSQKVFSSAISKLGVNSPKQFVYGGANKQLVNIKKPSGKAKILNQTIIRPAVESIQSKALTEDNVDFDINSMPIVLSDELLTPETLENIPIVLGEQAQKASTSTENMKIVIEKKVQNNSKLVTKAAAMSSASIVNSPTIRMPIVKRTPKILQTPKTTQKIIRQVTPSVSTKSAKFVVVSDSPSRPGQIIKKQTNVVRKTVPVTCAASSSTPGSTSESTGHKIMIFTNQQGKQQRLLLTPAQQKLFSMQVAGKTVMKSATAVQKSQLAKVQNSGLASTSKVPGQNVQTPKLVKTTVGTTVAGTPQMKIVPPRKSQKVFLPGNPMGKPAQQKTFLITNQHGQTVRKIQGTNEALLDKQVAEQLEAIKVSSMKAQLKQHEANARAAVANKPVQGTIRKPVVKRPEPKQTVVAQPKPHPTTTTTSGPSRLAQQHHIPPLSPIRQDKKADDALKQAAQAKPSQAKPERPLHQLVIQDNAGNQTTITEGQILALPSETVDGQPQSYMLVTLDETGNLTPLNNEALMSLDPSLAGLTGGDLSNMVLQMDPGAQKGNLSQTAQLQAAPTIAQEKPKPEVQQPVPPPPKPVEQIVAPLEQPAAQVQVTCNINGEPGQQIILTGDPAATQKFLDSLSDGSTDLANILAGAEGNSFLIQADGQQILINTEPSEAPMLRHNTSIAEQPEHRSPMFSTHPVKNQDILAAALADTDVFQQDQVSTQGKLTHSQLSPGQTLFPMNVGNVLETSLTLNSPIMTPLEVPSTNSKRIPDEEADILTTHVPKNVDLPITITDPNISQTVSHQQVLMASDLQSNLELTLPISETSMCVTSGMNSPSFVYSLPNLDVAEHAEINQKTFSSSMPLLTEDIEESHSFVPLPPKVGDIHTVTSAKKQKREERHGIVESMGTRRMMSSGGTFLEEGLCTLGAEMCSSLSEPPPEMFDIPLESEGLTFLNKTPNESKEKSDPVGQGLLMDDNSLEMSVQSQIVEFKDSSQSSDSSSSTSQDKTL